MNYTRKFILTFKGENYTKSDFLQPVNQLIMFRKHSSEKQLFVIELLVTIFFCFVPLLFNNPYRINIFLSWEGAYRLYLGQIPFKDFSLPMGYGYWVIPALFFKIFGPYMFSLIKAQVFINLISIFAFRSILKVLNVKPEIILLSVLVFCFSYISFNFWPWYNQSVFVFEIIGIYFLLHALLKSDGWKIWLNIALAAFFIFFSIFTKQDAGGIAVAIAYGMLSYDAIVERSFKKWIGFTGLFLSFAAIFVLPLLQYDFLYWYNHGQAPHNSRLVPMDFFNQIFGWAYWEKFFLLIIVLLYVDKASRDREILKNKSETLFAFLCIAIVLQAMVIQVTSPVPPKNEVFFYAFAFAYCMANIKWSMNLNQWKYLSLASMLIVFWWTGIYWRNIQRLIADKPAVVTKVENVAKHRYRLAKEFKTMEKLYLAEATINGIHKIQNLPIVKKPDLKVLNMSELTSLAYELGYTPLVNQPMWYHQNVAIFQPQVDEFCDKIRNKQYDLVLFQSIPHAEVANFFPEDVLICLKENYHYEFTFLAPRTPEESYVHVFTRP